MRFALVLIPLKPEYDERVHPIFGDVLACLSTTLGSMGHDVHATSTLWPDDARTILLNYCVAPSRDAPAEALTPPPGCIIYNQEAFDSPWSDMWPRFAHAVRARGAVIWEMRAENVARWREHFGVEAHHVPFGYVPDLENVPHAAEKPIDVLFYGSLSPRRAATMALMSRWGLRVKYHPHSPGDQRERLMGQAKVVLSLRFAQGYQVETIRLVHALANECFVVCEDGPGIEPFTDGLVPCDYESLAYTCAEWAGRSQEERQRVARRGRELARATQVGVREALVAAGL
jgi:hypothetical protein